MTNEETTQRNTVAFETLAASEAMLVEASNWLYENVGPIMDTTTRAGNISIALNRYYDGGVVAFVAGSIELLEAEAEIEAWIDHSETYLPWIEDGIDNVYSWATVGA